MIIDAPDETAMEALGERLAGFSRPGMILFLFGELGAGKTTLARGFLRALGHAGSVKSPTYTLVEPYDLGNLRVHHFDLYRLSDPEELELMGIRDYFDGKALALIEWPERARHHLPRPDLVLKLLYTHPGRRVVLSGTTAAGARALARLGAHQRS